jgi:Carboxypeptidase regulatory-like domain
MRCFAIVFVTVSFAYGQTPGLVKDCAADGTVVNSLTGDPIAHAQVVAGNDHGAATDTSGGWNIARLPCTATPFTVEHAGFLAATTGPGIPARDVRIRLTPEAAVVGKVLDEAGDPVTGAEVQIFDSVVKQGRRVMRESTSVNTNTAGEYRIGLLPPGRYIFCARSSKVTYPLGGGSHIAYGESCYPSPPSVDAGNALRMEAGQEVHADFRLPAVPGVHVRGTVAGVPEGSRVVVQIANAPEARQPSQIAKDNSFDFAGVVPGSYVIEGLAMVDGKSRFASAAVNLGSSDADGVALTFVPSVTVTGVVRFSGGKVPDDLKLNVSLIPSDLGSYAGHPDWDSTHASFIYRDISPGKYRVNTNSPPDPYYIESVKLHGRDALGGELTITGSTGPIEILIGDDGGKLEGSVADAGGKPAPGQIMLLRGSLPPQTSQSGENGRFAISNVPPGDYLAYAFDDSRNVEYAEPEWMRLNAGAGVPVSIQPGSSAAIALVQITTVPQ